MMDELNRQRDMNTTISWFLSNKSTYLDEEGPWIVDMIAKNLCHLYRTQQKIDKVPVKHRIKINKIAIDDYETEYLRPIIELHDYAQLELKPYLVDFLIHGSMATHDYSLGWSDLDTYVVIKSDVFMDFNNLVRLRKLMQHAEHYLYKIDPLQHHGFIYATEFDLSQYAPHCMPIEVLSCSCSLFKGVTYSIYSYRDYVKSSRYFEGRSEILTLAAQENILRHHAYKGKYLLENYGDLNTMYQMKYFLSSVMTLPVYYLDAIGEPCYKSESFDKMKEHIGFDCELEILHSASEIRSQWSVYEKHPYQTNVIPEWLREKLGFDYFRRASELSTAMLRSIK